MKISISSLILLFLAVGAFLRNDLSAQLSPEPTNQSQENKGHSNGITKEWLSNLTDENGNRILPEEESDALQRKVFNGLAAGSEFGISVSNAGDVNGDGFEDVIIGARSYGSNTGRAYIYFGGLIMNTIADLTLTGEATSNFFGNSVSSAGDVNGDGYSDVIVGAYGSTTNTGRAYIYFGSANMNNTPDVTMTGEIISSRFGESVSSAGDVNGDGYSDVFVGAYGYSSNLGRAYIFYGGASMNNAADVTMTGEAANNRLGETVSTAGDLNSDGYADVICGAYGYSSFTGRAYIFFGGVSMDNTPDVTLTGEGTNNSFGFAISSAGDINGDGYSDVIVGAHGHTSNTGRAFIFFGGASMNNTSDVTLTGEASGAFFGYAVSNAGDVNGDSYSDVVVGSYGISSFTGKTYIFFGGTSMNSAPDVVTTGEATSNFFGVSVSSGDFNGDGYSEVIVGADGYSSNTGRAYLYDYFMKNEIISELSITGEATGNYFGNSVSAAGDVNGDGYTDIIIGAYGNSSIRGRAYIYFGGVNLDNVPDVTMNGESGGDYFGLSAASAGDVNGDGNSDVIVGARGANTVGRAYIFFGGAAMDSLPDIVMGGETLNDHFGSSVSTAGDVNGDGFSDVIIGAPGFLNDVGKAYVYFGGTTMNNVADVSIIGDSSENNFGCSVSSAGDLNGDGYSDVVVGSDGYRLNTGRCDIFFGGANMNNASDVIMTGESTNSNFGISVSSAGDVNADGFSDVIIGAAGADKAYIYHGGITMNNTADVILTGEVDNDNFGYVSSAGDVNNDGYSDVIIGATFNNYGTGKSYVYFGGASMNGDADVTMKGESQPSYFGVSASPVGDINSDGYSDFIVGAPAFTNSTGRAYFYTGSAMSASPLFTNVKDVPNDQGGQLNLKWARSVYDVNGTNLITDYLIQRSYPPSGGNFAWENVAQVPATTEPVYSYTDQTPYDSTSNNTGTLFYRITARTSIASQFWRSAILSGRSIDNISPPLVSPFTATGVSNDVLLNWSRSSAPDLLNYILYRSTSPTIDPESEPVFATTTDSTYTDSSPLSGIYYYFIVAQDIHNNKSPVAMAESPNITLNPALFIEGFYNSGSNSQVSDTITVLLRGQNTPYPVIDIARSVVASDGSAVLKFSTAVTGNYYIVVKHRNTIETWSANPVTMNRGGSVNYDFTNAAAQAFGFNLTQVDASPIRFAIYSGDVNQDGTVDATDVSMIDNDAQNFVGGYVATDLTGDDFVDGTDFAIADNNAANFVSVIRP